MLDSSNDSHGYESRTDLVTNLRVSEASVAEDDDASPATTREPAVARAKVPAGR